MEYGSKPSGNDQGSRGRGPKNKKRGFNKNSPRKDKEKDDQPLATKGLAPMSLSLVSEFFDLSLKPNLRMRRNGAYVPDLRGLGDVCWHVWNCFRVTKAGSGITRDYHYITFFEETMRTAVLYIIWCQSLALPSAVWSTHKMLTFCKPLEGKSIPLFLSTFLFNVGSFIGPDGSEFVWSMAPGIDDEKNTPHRGGVTVEWASSFPNFKLYRRILANLVGNRPWSEYGRAPGPITEANPELLQRAGILSYPGLHNAPALPGTRVTQWLANMELEKLDGDYDADFYFQTSQAYDAYRRGIFDRLAEDGVPCAVMTLPKSMPVGTPIPNFIIRPSGTSVGDINPRYMEITTGDYQADALHMTMAAIFRPTYACFEAQVCFAEEMDVVRFDPGLMRESMKSNEFDKDTGLQRLCAKLFV